MCLKEQGIQAEVPEGQVDVFDCRKAENHIKFLLDVCRCYVILHSEADFTIYVIFEVFLADLCFTALLSDCLKELLGVRSKQIKLALNG